MSRLTLLEAGRIRAANTTLFLETCQAYRGLSDEFDWTLDDAQWVIDDLRAASVRGDESAIIEHLGELDPMIKFLADQIVGLN